MLQSTQSHGTQPGAQSWIDGRVGTSLGLCHRVLRPLACGGMAQVFLAEHIRTGAYAAAKLLHPASGIPEQQLLHEARLLARVQHPQIVRVQDVGRTSDGSAYLLLDYVRGVDLDEWQERSRQALTDQRLLRVLQQLAAALDHLHAHGIVHADVKPANVMLDVHADDAVTLVDFGVAFELGQAGRLRGVTGTPGYRAPEQLRAEVAGPSIDRFAMAVLALELLTGVRQQQDTLLDASQVRKWAGQTRPPLRHALEQVFARALHERPQARFASARAFVQALAAALLN